MKKQVITVRDMPPQAVGSQAVRVGDYIFLGGQVAIDGDKSLAPDVRGASGADVPTIAAKIQSDWILGRAKSILAAADSSLDLGLRIDQLCTHPRAASPYLEVRGRYVETPVRPASTHVQIESLLVPGALCGLQLIALAADRASTKQPIVVPDLPASPGPPFKPAPHGQMGGDFIFVTGQIAHGFADGRLDAAARTDPETWYGSPIKLQADVALTRCRKVLKHVGASMNDVVRADVYLNDMTDRFELEETWRRHFPADPPARSYIPTIRLGARSCIVEVNMIAIRPGSGLKKETITARNVPAPNLHQPHAVRAGGLLFVSGLCATDFESGLAPAARTNPDAPWFSSSAKRQMAFILDCLQSICRAGGSDLGQVAWTQNLHTRPEDLFPALEVWHERFPQEPPATQLAGVHGPLLGEGCTIQVDAVAAVTG
jgi:enamine deaminase RidA (YjgF/YER057c/UK114 family)